MKKLLYFLLLNSLGAVAQEKPFDSTYGQRAKYFRAMNIKNDTSYLLINSSNGTIDTLIRGSVGQVPKWGVNGVYWAADNAGGTTINTNGVNRLITGSNTSGELNGRTDATWNSTNFVLGTTTATSTATPVNLDLGGTYGSTVANSIKLKLYNDGTNVYGTGVSSAQYNFLAPTGSGYYWHVGGSDVFHITSGGAVNIPGLNGTGDRVSYLTSAGTLARSNVDPATLEGLAAGQLQKNPAEYATTAALAANTYNNGTSGVGATLTGNANGALSVDGSTPSVSDRVLVKDEATASRNGIYTVTQVGDGANPYILTRATDFDETSEVVVGAAVDIRNGTTNAGRRYVQNQTGTITIGTTSITFAQTITNTGLVDPGSNGIPVRTAFNTTVARSIAGTTNEITVTNGDGVSGNPTISLPTTLSLYSKNITVKDGSSFTIADGADNTKQIEFDAVNVSAGNTRIVTFPDANITVVGTNTTQTLTNKSIDASQLTGTVATARLGSGTANQYTTLHGDQTYKQGWVTVRKAANEARNTTATLTADTDLQFSMAASTSYTIRIRVWYTTAATPDFKYGLSGPASPTSVRVKRSHIDPAALTTLVSASEVAYTSSVSMAAGTGTTGGWVEMEINVDNGTNAGTFAFMWAQNTSNGGSTTVLKGSYLEYTSN